MALTKTLLSKEQSTVELSEYRYDFSKQNLGHGFQLIFELLDSLQLIIIIFLISENLNKILSDFQYEFQR